jgi:hypothetical protein
MTRDQRRQRRRVLLVEPDERAAEGRAAQVPVPEIPQRLHVRLER